MSEKLLEVKSLKKYFPIKKGVLKKTVGHVKALNNVTFTIDKGETFGLVGESGCGKSTTGRCIIRLLEPTSGEIWLNGQEISKLKDHELKSVRHKIQMIFQNPYASLNPRKTVQQTIEEPMIVNLNLSKEERVKRVVELLDMVGLQQEYLNRYPHEFSGGQRQRIAIARALSISPELVIADEAVSALDVSIQSQILNLLKRLQKELRLTYLFISHDLGVIKHVSDKVGVMYLGEIVEITDKNELFNNPIHPYTKALLSAIPVPDVNYVSKRIILQGDVPNPANPPSGCYFHLRCPEAKEECKSRKPELKEIKDGHYVSCNLYFKI